MVCSRAVTLQVEQREFWISEVEIRSILPCISRKADAYQDYSETSLNVCKNVYRVLRENI